jgi:hypothetical protein
MKLPGLKSRVSFGLPGFAGLPTLRSGRHSSPGLKAWGFLAGFIKGDSMIYFKDHKTINIFDPLSFLGPKRKKLIDTSWAKLFREQILPDLPADKVFKNYHWAMGRPTKELYAMLGVMTLQQMQDLTDEETIHQFAFNIEWHYALGITDESDDESYL